MESNQLKMIIEGALLASGRSLDIKQLEKLFDEDLFGSKKFGSEGDDGESQPPRDQIQAVLEDIEADCEGRGFELKRTGSGYRFQVRNELSEWVSRLWEEKPKKYSRALLETLALIAYRQPITRGDIEEIRGVSVSSEIIKTLLEREWVRVVGHRDVPGRPALYATTKQFLDYFSLQSLEELPALNDIKDIEEINPELALEVAQHMMANVKEAPEGEVLSPESDSDESSSVMVGASMEASGLFQDDITLLQDALLEKDELEEGMLEESTLKEDSSNQSITDQPEINKN
jgi:segregation and condensation protein B